MKKKRFNIERLAFMVTIVIIITLFGYFVTDDKSSVWQFTFFSSIFLLGAYFTFYYFSDTNIKFKDIFYQKYQDLPKFSWKKFLEESIVFVSVIIFLLLAGLVKFILERIKQ